MVKILGSLLDSNEKEIKRFRPVVERINSLEPEYQALSDDQLRQKTAEFKARLEKGESLDKLLPEAFAAVREVGKRTLGQRHFDVQLMGGIVLHQGKIAEMKTGEGKTLVATLPIYLNALLGKGAHLITVNDYLAKRDCHWMGPIYNALGISVASIQHEASFLFDPTFESEDRAWKHLKPVSRREAYAADITYGTNNEFGFDYLRDNMVVDTSQCAQRPLYYAIVDEVDYILIDEARTPLIISGQAEEAAQKYRVFAKLVPRLHKDEDYKVDEKDRVATLTEEGISKVEGMLRKEGVLKASDLYDSSNYLLTSYLDSALKAHALYRRDRDYVVKDGEVIIVDEFTGRLMQGRRYSEGLHQAIEAKEGVAVQRENITMATITFQNYFRLYEKLAGMTGTAVTEAEELHKIYKLEVVVMPTNKPMVRTDQSDQIYQNEEAKFRAVVREIEKLNAEGRPVLVGTVSIEKSEHLSELLKIKGIPHQVLNAKLHEKEAAIIAQAGQPGAVTVATNMAGRGVDIILGGSPPDYRPYEDVDEYILRETREFIVQGIDFLKEQGVFKGWRQDIQNDLTHARDVISVQEDVIRRRRRDYLEAANELDDAKLSEIEGEISQQEQILKAALEKYQSLLESQADEIEEQLKSYLPKAEKLEKPSIIQRIKSLIGIKEKPRQGKRTIADILPEQREQFVDWLRRHRQVKDVGGLHVLGTERHEARRIDNQLRGRAGRQGDSGSSRFFVSLEDDVMRRFGGERVKGLMEKFHIDEDQPIEHGFVNKAIEEAQKKIEGFHFDIRKHLVDYDDVVNKHRQVIYDERRKITCGADIKSDIQSMITEQIKGLVASHLSGNSPEEWNLEGLANELGTILPLPPGWDAKAMAEMGREEIEEKLLEHANALYEAREKEFGAENMRVLERLVMLRAIDRMWIDHLTAMEDMRHGIGLHAVGQRDPLIVYKQEGHAMFQSLLAGIQHEMVHTIYKAAFVEKARTSAPPPIQSPMAEAAQRREAVPAGKKVGRNDPCPCGSGKKYKKCCGR